VYQFLSKSDDFSLRYGDFTIYKMAAASSYKMLLKSDNRLMSYGQKSDFKDGGHRHLKY